MVKCLSVIWHLTSNITKIINYTSVSLEQTHSRAYKCDLDRSVETNVV